MNRRKNLLIISLDCMRPEALECYPQRFPWRVSFPQTARTPHIHRLATEGHRFDQAITQAPFTPAAHASLFTGLNPPRHGIRTILGSRLREEVTVLPQVLAAEGWRCAAVVGSHALSHEYGLARGFDDYDDEIRTGRPSWILGERRDAREVTDRALTWLDSLSRRPFFLMVHYFDAHDIPNPSLEERPGAELGTRPAPLKGRPGRFLESVKSAMRPAWRAIHSRWEGGKDYLEIGSRYQGYGRRFMLRQVAQIDEQIGRLLQALADRNRLDQTLILVLADHGDDFMEHGERTHRKYLYDTTLRIPLILYPRLGARSIVRPQVRMIDVFPSILDLLGIGSEGIEMDGTSWMDLIDTAPHPPSGTVGRSAYAETVMETARAGESEMVTCLAALRAPPWKLVWDRLTDSFALFHLEDDPGELRNQGGSRPQIVARLSAQLLPLAQERPRGVPETEGDKMAERLRFLGYI